MNIAKYMVMGILGGIFNMYPISYNIHFYICQEMFNTKIFYDTDFISLLNIEMIISIIFIYRVDIINFIRYILRDFKRTRKNKKKDKNYLKESSKNIKYVKCVFISSSIGFIINMFFRYKEINMNKLGYCFIITTIFILFTHSKKGIKKYDEITYTDSIIVGLATLFMIIPTMSTLLCYLFACTKQHMTKKTSLRYSLTCLIPILLFNSVSGLVYIINDQTYLFEIVIGIVVSVFVSCGIYKSLKYMYYTNKLYRLALYTLFLALFIFYWFV